MRGCIRKWQQVLLCVYRRLFRAPMDPHPPGALAPPASPPGGRSWCARYGAVTAAAGLLLLVMLAAVPRDGSVQQLVLRREVRLHATCTAHRLAQQSADHDKSYPKIVHRIFGFWDPRMPEHWSYNYHTSCHESEAGFKRILWNKTMTMDLLERHYSWFIPTFLSYPYEVQRTDVARYFILYHYGGIYLDMDIRCVETGDPPRGPLPAFYSTVPPASTAAVLRTKPIGYTQSFFMAQPCSPVLNRLIARLEVNNVGYILPYATIMFSTGPRLFSDQVDQYLQATQEASASSPAPPPPASAAPTPGVELQEDVALIGQEAFWERYFAIGGKQGTWHRWDAVLITAAGRHLRALLVMAGVVAGAGGDRRRLGPPPLSDAPPGPHAGRNTCCSSRKQLWLSQLLCIHAVIGLILLMGGLFYKLC